MKQLVVRAVVGLALVCTLLGGIAMSRQAASSAPPAHRLLACGEAYLPPCD